MAIAIYRQANQTGRVDMRDPEVTLSYLIKATGDDKFDESAVEDAMEAEAPLTYSGLGQRSIAFSELGNGVYEATATYRLLEGSPLPTLGGAIPPGDPPPPGAPGAPPPPPAEAAALDETYSFQTSGGTQHITQSRRTVSKTRRGGGTAPDFKGAIGVNRDRVDGCDIFVGKLEFQMVKEIPAVSLSYVKVLRELTGSVNDREFYHFGEGECLFLGATGQTKGPEGTGGVGGWVVTYAFAVSETETDVEIVPPDPEDPETDPGLVVPEKRGWDYLWVYYEPAVSEDTLGRVPLAAYVEEVYPYKNHYRLRI